MEKLIAKRPIQYMGRIYEIGEPVPAYDGRMVNAWMEAGSVERIDPDAVEAGKSQEPTAEAVLATAASMAADTLRGMGVNLEDETAFLNVGNVAELVSNITTAIQNAQKQPREERTEPKEQEHADAEKAAQGAARDATEAKMVSDHLDTAQLERMTKAELTDLAVKLGVDTSTAKNNAERAALIAAVEVRAPADENGGAQ